MLVTEYDSSVFNQHLSTYFIKKIDSMASIGKRGKSYRAQVSLYKHGQHKKLSQTFTTKNEAKFWGLEIENSKR